jgi:hypothetical protein
MRRSKLGDLPNSHSAILAQGLFGKSSISIPSVDKPRTAFDPTRIALPRVRLAT